MVHAQIHTHTHTHLLGVNSGDKIFQLVAWLLLARTPSGRKEVESKTEQRRKKNKIE